jgi:hypothetical protein
MSNTYYQGLVFFLDLMNGSQFFDYQIIEKSCFQAFLMLVMVFYYFFVVATLPLTFGLLLCRRALGLRAGCLAAWTASRGCQIIAIHQG